MTHSIALVNMRDGSVQGHKAGCADLKRGARKFADEPWTFDVESKADARFNYNADFDYDVDGWYEIEWLPCANHVPEGDIEAFIGEDTDDAEPTVTYADPENARRNFLHMAQTCGTEAGRNFWQAQADAI